MAKEVKRNRKKTLDKAYYKIFKEANTNPLSLPNPQWISNGDYFVKFSLYKETPSVASPNTFYLMNS
jgi:hypothetical protein